MKPYYEDDSVSVYEADALDLLRSLPDDSVQLIATDPPYFRVKDEAWDNAWKSERAFLLWMRDLCREWRRVLAPNGSLYVFASPQMAHVVERVIRRHFRVLNAITWRKEEGWHKRTEKEAQRSFSAPWERVVFAEQVEQPYDEAARVLHLDLLSRVGSTVADAVTGAGMDPNDVDVALGYVRKRNPNRGTELCRRWTEGSSIPSPDDYDRLSALLGGLPPYREYVAAVDDARAEYRREREKIEHLRRPFNATADAPYTDVWDFPTVGTYPGKHPCEKPLAMMEHIVRISSRPGGTVLDSFSGSGATAEAARNLGRKAIVGDSDPHWCRQTALRVSQGSLLADLEAA